MVKFKSRIGVVKGQALKLVNDNDLWAHDIGRNPFRFPLIFPLFHPDLKLIFNAKA